jgi:hypothetical protein
MKPEHNKSFTRYCLKYKTKLFDLKKCSLCQNYELKQGYDIPKYKLPKNSGLLGHFKFNSCQFSANLNRQELVDKKETNASVKNISKISSRIIDKLKHNSKVTKNIIINNWENIVGNQFKDTVVPYKIIKSVLYVKTESPTITENFHFMNIEIMDNINNLFDKPVVKKIKAIQ